MTGIMKVRASGEAHVGAQPDAPMRQKPDEAIAGQNGQQYWHKQLYLAPAARTLAIMQCDVKSWTRQDALKALSPPVPENDVLEEEYSIQQVEVSKRGPVESLLVRTL